MSITLGVIPQLNNYYKPPNGSYSASATSPQNAASANGQTSVTKTDLAGQSSEVTKKSDPNYVCQTCKERKYQDQSNDPGVSFKTPGHISPGSSAAVVASHEQEHVSNERAKAGSEGRRIVSQTVTLHYAVCPECHKTYVSGGVTRTVTASDNRPENGNLLDIKV